MNALNKLTHLDELETLLRRSSERPVLIFKHSATCGTSAYALEELHTWLASIDRPVDTAIVVVQSERIISDAITHQLKLHHQSPQAILVRDRKVLWHKSHYSITADTLNGAFLALN